MPNLAPRTLADQLRGWSDEQLAHLLGARPDLFSPVPQDLAQLASRASTRSSVQRIADQLSQLELAVVDASLAMETPLPADRLQALVNGDPATVRRAVDRLRALALIWGDDTELRGVSALHDVVGTRISGLAPSVTRLLADQHPPRLQSLGRELGLTPTGDRAADVAAIAGRLRDCTVVDALVAGVGDRARAILRHLDQESSEGVVESTERSTSRGADLGPVDQLLAVGLLVARDRKHVVVPCEVSVCLRGGHTTHEPLDQAPALNTSTRSEHLVDRTAAGAAAELVSHVEVLLETWGATAPAALRAGGLAVRDLRAAASLLHTDERVAALHVEVAHAAGLLEVGETPDGEIAWLPTDGFDLWTAGSVAQRWRRLAQAWLRSSRSAALVGNRPSATGPRAKTVNALTPDLERPWLPETRRAVLAEIGTLAPGTALATGTGTSSLVERMSWLRPRRPAERDEAVAWTVEEATTIGVVGLGGLTGFGRALLDGGDVEAVLEPLLPEPVDHVLVQADLTAIAPGPLEQDLAHRLLVLADVESRGGATVYRFTEGSVRRAFDSGWSATEVHAFLAAASRTPIPQALTYLVEDVARRFGTIRVGSAEAFLRSDDEGALTALVHAPEAASLRLRRIAPTVLVSDVPVDVLLQRLRELGTAPIVEAADGTVRVVRRAAMRSRAARGHDGGADDRDAARRVARVSAAVSALRAGDRAAAARPDPSLTAAPSTPGAHLAALHAAVESRRRVWIAYLDSHGSTLERIVDPIAVDAGWLRAFDHRVGEVRTFAVHRVSAVRLLERQTERPDSR